jgi:hypothetical protein
MNFCGMIVELLHSGYSLPCKPFSDSDDTVTLRWFKARKGAKRFPFITAFGSHVWQGSDPPTPGPGEVDGPQQWVETLLSPYDGQHFHGNPQWFRFGLPVAELLVPPAEPECPTPCLQEDTSGYAIWPEQGQECIEVDD